MGVELLLLHVALMLVLGPAVIVYGVVIVARRRVRLIGSRVIGGTFAVIAGTAMMIVGLA